MPNAKEVSLKVAEAIQDDVNKGITRIDTSSMHIIGVRPGDVIEIVGARSGVSIVDRSYPGDIGMNIIRMDGLIRKNAKTSIGENVIVRRAEIKEAEKVTIAPAKEGIVIRGSPTIFKQGFLGRPVSKGDVIALGGTRRRRNTMSGSPFFDDVFRMMEEEAFNTGLGFGELKFVVVETSPKGAVLITDKTEITLNPEAIEIKEDVVPDVTYEDVGGLEPELKKIKEMVELPLRHPEIFERLGIEAPKGVLLHGPPGTGKTLLAKAVANECNSHFLVINGPEIMSKFYGQSEENLRNKFEEAQKNAPAIVFIDEIDAIAPKREEVKGEVERRVVAQLLALMDGLKSRGKVVVIAATNIPNSIDPALRRPGRFDRELEIGVPNKDGRFQILKIHTRNMPIRGSLYITDFTKALLEEIENKLSETNKETIEKEIKQIQEEIEKLKEDVKRSENSFVEKIKALLAGKEKRLEELKKRLPEISQELKEIEGLEAELKDDKDLLLSIYREAKEIERAEEIWRDDDPRQQFRKIVKGKLEDKLYKILESLIELKILTPALYKRARDRGVEKDLRQLADITYGFVGADLSSLAKEAAMSVLRRILPDIKPDNNTEQISPEMLERLIISKKDFYDALKVVRPSAMREVLVEIPDIKWEDVGGLEDVKQKIKEAVEWPLKNPDAFKRMGIKPPKGILLYGPPGTGKTLLAKAVANESQANFILVKGPEMLSKWVGESEKAVREIFKKARQTSPTIIFFDEIDALAPRRGMSSDSHVTERVVNQMLTEMDGLEEMNDVVIIGASNRPDIIDPALLRPGRFDRILLIPPPEAESRKQIFKVHTIGMPITLLKDEEKEISKKSKDKDTKIEEEKKPRKKSEIASAATDRLLTYLSQETEGYVGADIESICREAAIHALRENIEAKEVTLKNFKVALDTVRPSVTKETEKTYEELESGFKAATAKQMREESPSYFG